MKARIPSRQQFSNRSLKAVDEYIQEESHNMSRRLFKLVAVALNELYDFGAKCTRIMRKWNNGGKENENR